MPDLRGPLSVESVGVVVGYGPDGLSQGATLSSTSLTSGVSTASSVVIRLSRPLLPAAIARQAICLRPRLTDVPDISACTSPRQPFVAPTYDPVMRTVTYRMEGGLRLLPDTAYRLTIFASDIGLGLFAWDGGTLTENATFDFVTQDDRATAPDIAAPNTDEFCRVVSCFDACAPGPDGDSCRASCRDECAASDCFADGQVFNILSESCGGSPCHSEATGAAGLDLSSSVGLHAAINRIANFTATGDAAGAKLSPLVFGRGMPLIRPEDPGNSALLYKLITHPLNYPASDWAMITDDMEALRGRAQTGRSMPAAIGHPRGLVELGNDAASREASLVAMRAISTWIEAGAPTDCD